jgi:purine-cytosine permease-like protein
MNTLKKALGIVWVVLGPLVMFYLVKTGVAEMAKKPGIDTRIEWIVFIGIFIPIAIGLVLFGYYSLKGEYDADGSEGLHQ